MSGGCVVRACSTKSRIILTPLSIYGLRVVVVVVVNDVIYSRLDLVLVAFGRFVDCLLLSISALNENGSLSVLSSSIEIDSLLVTSFDDG